MKLANVAPRRGSVWVREGFRVFFARPMAFAGLFATFLFAVFVLALLPFIGPLLVLATLPLVSLGFMIATRKALAGDAPGPAVFVEPLRGDRNRRIALWQLGVLYAVATYAIIWIADVADGGAFDALMDALPAAQTSPGTINAKMADPRLEIGMILRFGLAVLLSIPFWHAPALVHWDGHTAPKALFSSTVACWRNMGAFTVYGLVWLGVILAFGIAANLLVALFGQLELMKFTVVPLTLVFSTVFYASLYFTFADCFHASDAPLGASA